MFDLSSSTKSLKTDDSGRESRASEPSESKGSDDSLKKRESKGKLKRGKSQERLSSSAVDSGEVNSEKKGKSSHDSHASTAEKAHTTKSSEGSGKFFFGKEERESILTYVYR